MKPITTLLMLLFVCAASFAQISREELDKEIKPLKDNLKTLTSENTKLNASVRTLQTELAGANKSIDSLRSEIRENEKSLSESARNLGSRIDNTNANADIKFSNFDSSLSRKSLYAIIAVLCSILLSGFLYWLLSKRQKSDKSDFINELNNAKSSIEESLVKEFGKQTDLIGSQLHLLEKQKQTIAASPAAEPDHSFALKVAGEINLIERNISLMDSKTKGLKQLQASVGKLKDNLAANGYEMPVLLGKKYQQGMNVIIASSIPGENMEEGTEVFSKILIPQVNYNNKIIQVAQVELSVG